MTARLVAQMTHLEPRFKVKTLSLALTFLSAALAMPAYALETISDSDMSDAIGEGIAIIGTNIQLQMPSVAGDVSQSGVLNPYSFGACQGASCSATDPGRFGSYIYISPVGPAVGGNKTDVYLYGLSLSQNDNLKANPDGSVVVPAAGLVAGGAIAHNSLFNSAAAGGVNWGLKGTTATPVQDPFTLIVNTSSQPGLDGGAVTPAVPLLQLSAPTMVTSDPNDLAYSGNNLRLGFWTNIQQYNSTLGSGASASLTSATSNGTQNQVGTAGPALQLQAIWDGFGINGTKINLFPTAACSGCTPGGATGNSDYARTFGLTGVVRLNSQKNGVLRVSTAESGATPAIGVFDPYDGIYIQNLDVNLTIGALNFQPLIISSTGQLGQVTLELARIPDVATAYKKFYVDYTGADPTYLSPTSGMCYSGGCPIGATHSNITAGDVYVNDGVSTPTGGSINPVGYATGTVVMANGDIVPAGGADALYTSVGALAGTGVNGISFKAPAADGLGGSSGATVNLGTAAISGLMINHLKMTLTSL